MPTHRQLCWLHYIAIYYTTLHYTAHSLTFLGELHLLQLPEHLPSSRGRKPQLVDGQGRTDSSGHLLHRLNHFVVQIHVFNLVQ